MQLPAGPIGKLNSQNKNVTIIGAGVSGMLMGYYLKKAGYQVTIYEKDSQVGGKINTVDTDYGPAETAANAIFTNDDVLELVNELDLNYSTASHKLKKYVWRNGKAKTPPFTFAELMRIGFGLLKKIDKNDLNKKTIYDFFSPMMGNFFAGQIMSAALGGVYAEPTDKIHFQSLFKTPFSANRYGGFFRELMKKKKERSKNKAQSIGFEGGMKTFIKALEKELKENIQYTQVESIDEENVIICTDATSASKIIRSKNEKVSKLLEQIKYNAMYTTTVFTDKAISFLNNGFGVVFPPGENFKNLGILHNTAIFPGRVTKPGTYSYTFMTKTNDGVDEIIQTEIDKIAGENFHKHIIFKNSTRWQQAIPIYDLNRFENILKIRTEMNNIDIGVVLFGNYIDGISIREMVSAAKNFVKELEHEQKN